MPPKYPIADHNRLISEASADLLSHRKPSTWWLTKQDGSTDFGFDYSIQVAVERQVRHAVRAQLKGTTTPKVSADGQFISIGISQSTLNLFAASQDEILLLVAVVVLQDDDKVDLVVSRIYWQWVSAELTRIRGSRYKEEACGTGQVNLRVPTSQEVTPALDIVDHLERRRLEAQATEEIQTIATERGIVPPGAADPMQQFVKVFRERPSVILSIESDDRLDTRQSDEFGTALAQITALLRAGLTEAAEDALAGLDIAQVNGQAGRQASLLVVQGKIAVQRRRRPDALALFERAYDLSPTEGHLLAQEEIRFLLAIDTEDTATISAVERSLAQVQSDEGLSLLARVLVSQRRLDEANAVVDRIASSVSTMPRLVVLSGQRRWAEARNLAKTALENLKLSRLEAMAVRLVAARSCWSLALSTTTLGAEEQETPLSGAPGLDPAAAKAAWDFSRQCLHDLKKLGWQPNTELIAPIAVASAAATGHQEEALALMRDAGSARPEYQELQENLELLAISSGNAEIALEANRRLPDTHAVLVRRAGHLFQLRDYSASANTALQLLTTLDQAVPQTPMALVMGAAAASKLGRAGDADLLGRAVRSNGAWGEFEYFARFIQSNESRSDNRTLDLQPLREGLENYPDSKLLAANLFSNLNATTSEVADEVVTLSKRIRRYAELSVDDEYRLVDALLKLSRWEEAEVELRSCIERFGEAEMSLSLLAVAAEMQGKTGSAIDALDRSFALGKSHASSLRNYLGLCLRLGRSKAAQETIERLLAHERDHEKRLELLRLNALCLLQLDRAEDAFAVVKVIGTTVRQDVEKEEGMYLTLFITTTKDMARLPEEDLAAVGKRSDTFSVAWPESRWFRVMKLPDGDIKATLNEILKLAHGMDPEARLREFAMRERKAREGLLSVPFLLRPSYLFHYITDAFTLWRYATASGREDRQYHLTIAIAGQQDAPDSVLRGVPLLDLSALLVLQSLGLFGILFSVFPRVAVSRATVAYISQHAAGTILGRVESEIASSLLKFINDNVEKIDQPATPIDDSRTLDPRDIVDDNLKLAKLGRWVLYWDDASTRIWAQQDGKSASTMSTMDLLHFADVKSLLTAAEVGNHLTTLASWNVGITISPRHFLALAERALTKSGDASAAERLQALLDDSSFSSMARAIWTPEKQPVELINHIAVLVASMLIAARADERSVTALWAFWFNRMRLAPVFNDMGWSLLYLSLSTALAHAAAPGSRRNASLRE
jgi:tetratricopeptide (TPR) repeat protein